MVPRLLLWPFASVHEEAYRLGYVVQRALLLPGLLYIDCDPQGAQALRSFQIFKLNVLNPWGQIPCCLHILNIFLVLDRLLNLGVDHHNGAWLRQAFVRAADSGLVNALFDDFVAHVILTMLNFTSARDFGAGLSSGCTWSERD